MNEQRVELFIKERKFSFMIPFNDYVPFKKAEKKIINLIENIEHTDEQLDEAIVYSALQLAIQNEKLITEKSERDQPPTRTKKQEKMSTNNKEIKTTNMNINK